VRKIAGVNAEKLRFAIIEAALKKHELPIGGTDAQKVQRLSAYYREYTPKDRLADCSVCDGVSDINEPACPFCGDGGVEDSAIVHEIRRSAALTPVQELDAAVARIRDLKVRAAESMWELGSEVKTLYDSQLWRQRKREDGAESYTSWGHFCEEELNISNSYSYRLMDISAQFSREQVRELGPTKLAMTLKVPAPERVKMLQAAASGATVTQLRDMVRDIGAIPQGEDRGAKGGTRHHKKRKVGRKKEWVKIGEMLVRREMVPKREDAAVGVKIRLPGPLAVEEWIIKGGVKQRIVLTNEIDGTLILVVERSRT